MINEELKEITKKISTPLLSRAGKAMKVPLPKCSSRFRTPNELSSPKGLVTIEHVKEELRRIEIEKLKAAKETFRPTPTWTFKAVSRSYNISPGNVSPPPTAYHPNYEFLNNKVKGAIQYHTKIMAKSRSTKLRKLKEKPMTSPRKQNAQLEVSKSLALFELLNSASPQKPLESPLSPLIKRQQNPLA